IPAIRSRARPRSLPRALDAGGRVVRGQSSTRRPFGRDPGGGGRMGGRSAGGGHARQERVLAAAHRQRGGVDLAPRRVRRSGSPGEGHRRGDDGGRSTEQLTMEKITSILVASDLSEESDEVVRAAGEIARATGATVHLLNAFDLPPEASVRKSTAPVTFAQRIEEAEQRLDEQIRRGIPEGVSVGSRRV